MFRIERLHHREPAVAARIHDLLARAHAQEAALLGVDDGVGFEQTPEAIRASDLVFFGACEGAAQGDALLGLIALGPDDDARDIRIAVLVVDAEHQRQGMARALLGHAFGQAGGAVFSVVAAVSNLPAMALYRGLGFVESQRGTLGSRALEVVKLRTVSPASPEPRRVTDG